MIFTNRRTKSLITYTKTECLDCDSILSVNWQQEYIGMFQTSHDYLKKISCPFCKNTQPNTNKINEKEFNKINKMWDLTDSAIEDDSEQNNNCSC